MHEGRPHSYPFSAIVGQEKLKRPLLLCAAALGQNHVEREGFSFNHPSRFILVGTMNPDEGQLRPS